MTLNTTGTTYQRPWGTYTTLKMADNHQVKSITVMPGGKLSLQSHQHRAEHWVIVQGIATVTLNEDARDYGVNQAIYIAIGDKHRLENRTETPITLIEVQIGDHLGEDDITRYADIYQR